MIWLGSYFASYIFESHTKYNTYFLFLEAIIGYYTRTRKIAEIFRSIKSRNKLRIVSGRGRWHVIINERRSQTVGNL